MRNTKCPLVSFQDDHGLRHVHLLWAVYLKHTNLQLVIISRLEPRKHHKLDRVQFTCNINNMYTSFR